MTQATIHLKALSGLRITGPQTFMSWFAFWNCDCYFRPPLFGFCMHKTYTSRFSLTCVQLLHVETLRLFALSRLQLQRFPSMKELHDQLKGAFSVCYCAFSYNFWSLMTDLRVTIGIRAHHTISVLFLLFLRYYLKSFRSFESIWAFFLGNRQHAVSSDKTR